MLWFRRAAGWAGVVVGPLITIASLALLFAGVAQFGLPVLAWIAIGNAIFLVSGAAVVAGALKAEQRAVSSADRAAQRLRHLQGDREFTDETFYAWELIKPGAKPIVENRVFTDCTIQGPAMVGLIANVSVESGSMGEGALDSILHEMVAPGEKQGVIGFVSCRFVRCRFRGIGFYGPKELMDQIRAGTALV